MPDLETPEQVTAYLAEIQPSKTFLVHPFATGWVCREQIPQGETLTRGLGMASLIVDKETGLVTVHSSGLSTRMAAEKYDEAKRTGQPPPGQQIYPHRWRITLRRIREDTDTIDYQMTTQSLTDPPEPTREHQLHIEKRTNLFEPADGFSARATSHALWVSNQNQGVWPEMDTSEM
jgi:hypothetical protein